MNIIPANIVELRNNRLVVHVENINNSDPSARTDVIERNRATLTAKLVLDGWTLEAAQAETAQLDYKSIATQLSEHLAAQRLAETTS